MLPEDPLFHKPKSIVAAKNILYASLFLSIINWVFSQGTPATTTNAKVQGIITLILTLVIIFALIKQIGLGRKWARVVLLVLFIAGLLFFPWTLFVLFKLNLLVAVISLLLAILQLVALIFLFSKESTQWFNRVHAANQNDLPPAEKQ
jgi:hypothetical protein